MRRYLFAATAARLADAMWIGPVLLVLDRTGSATLAGLTLSAATLPTLVSAPLLGAWLDTHGRRRVAGGGGRRRGPGCARARRAGLVHPGSAPPLRAVTVASVLTQLPGGLMGVAAAPLAVALGAGRSAGGLLLAAIAAGAAAGAPLL